MGGGHGIGPVHITAIDHRGGFHGALKNHAFIRFVHGHVDGLVQKRLVFDHLFDFNAAGRGYDGLGFGVIDAGGQFIGGKSTKDHGVDRADARTGKHGDGRLGDHGHVDEHPVALGHPLCRQNAGKLGGFITKFPIGIGFDRIGHRTVINQRRLIGATVFDMQIQCVVAGVQLTAGKPAIEWLVAVIQDLVPTFIPVAILGCFTPKTVRIVYRLRICNFVLIAHQ